MKRHFLGVALLNAVLFTVFVIPALAEVFPSKTVVIVAPFPPGGGVDMLARALASGLSKLWGQPVMVENFPGAGTIIGAGKVANARPDGYELLLTLDPTVASNRFFYKKLPYDPDKSLFPITMIARTEFSKAYFGIAAVRQTI